MRIINLSVDGIKQAAAKGLFDWLEQQDADIICLQDLRLPTPELEDGPYQVPGFNAYFLIQVSTMLMGLAFIPASNRRP